LALLYNKPPTAEEKKEKKKKNLTIMDQDLQQYLQITNLSHQIYLKAIHYYNILKNMLNNLKNMHLKFK
jgi:hypothetical protein